MFKQHFDEDEDLLQYMVPGSTLRDICTGEEEYDGDDIECAKVHEEFNADLYYDAMYDTNDVSESTLAELNKDGSGVVGSASHANAQGASSSLAKFQPAQHKHSNAKVLNKIKLDQMSVFGKVKKESYVCGFNNNSNNNGDNINKIDVNSYKNDKYDLQRETKKVDRSERATVENVLDPRTRLILYKLVNTGILREINGCVSTGKEANVYYAVCADGSDAALKIFKTSILVFRDRDQYVNGEFRFQRYCKSNPRKMVRTWAEKEARNLCRLQEGGVLAPAVKLLRQHVLVMEFLGEDGWPAPRLKEVRFPSFATLDGCYLDLCATMRKMYARCKLIHGDLSEYNLLLFRGRVVVIDVSQSVESDHPRAMDFLRRDIVNIHAFFRAQGHHSLLSHQELFYFITAPSASDGWQRCTGGDNTDELIAYLKELRQRLVEMKKVDATQGDANTSETTSQQELIDEQVFLHIPVPRTLNEFSDEKVLNAEMVPFVNEMTGRVNHMESVKKKQHAEHVHNKPCNSKNVPSTKNNCKQEQLQQHLAVKQEEHIDASSSVNGSDHDDESDDVEKDNSEEDSNDREKIKRTSKNKPLPVSQMSKEERKAHKKAVKEANRERRVQKKQRQQHGHRSTHQKNAEEHYQEQEEK